MNQKKSGQKASGLSLKENNRQLSARSCLIRHRSDTRENNRPRGARPASTYKHWLSGIVKCPACGRTMTACKIENNKQTYCYFRCYGYSKGKCAAKNSISSLKLEPAVLESIKSVLDTGKITYRKIEAKTEDTADLKTILEDQIKKIDVKLQRIKEAYMNGIDTMEEYKENKRIVQGEKDSLEKQLSELKRRENKHQK